MRRIPTAQVLRPRIPGSYIRRLAAVPPPALGAPAARLALTEMPRAAMDLTALATMAPALAAERRGDGHPVLVLPGMVGGDVSTLGLRRYLTWLGYSVSGGGLGMNAGPTEAVVSRLQARLRGLATTSGRPVSIIGWSLGGLYAHELARRAPGSVRQVVTLGSPIRLARPSALRVPATSLYTRSDGIVSWRACLLRPGRRRQNIEVYGSHLGMVVNPTVLHVLAARLAQPAHTWRRFRPGPLTRHFYP